MSGLLSSPPLPPHINQYYNNRMSPSPTPTSAAGGSRKRKLDDDADERMSASPSASPDLSSQPLPSQAPHQRTIKRPRPASAVGRPLTLPRLLETLEADSLRTLLKTLCDTHPQLKDEVLRVAPRPNPASAIDVLRRYEQTLIEHFPFGGDRGSDYAFNRVRQHLMALLDALNEFTPHYLPPHESQTATSLAFLDEATHVIHRLPEWRSFQNNFPKHNAYEEMSRAWVRVIQEASKRAAGISLRYESWDRKLAKHNELAGGRMQAAVDELNAVLGWAGPAGQLAGGGGRDEQQQQQQQSAVQELLAGTYGSNVPVRVGPW